MSAIEIKVVEGMRMEAKSPAASTPIAIDAPKQLGGGGADMSPTDLVAVSLATCMQLMMGIKAKSLGVDLTGTRIEVEKTMVLVPVMKITGFHVHFHLPAVAQEHRRALEETALHCPIHTALSSDVKQDVQFHWG